MKQDIPLYLLTVALLGAAIYLHSPIVCASIIPLWGINAAQIIMTRRNKDIDVVAIQESLVMQSKKIESLSHDIRNVQERAKVILGETY
jgi:hypothetical protein